MTHLISRFGSPIKVQKKQEKSCTDGCDQSLTNDAPELNFDKLSWIQSEKLKDRPSMLEKNFESN